MAMEKTDKIFIAGHKGLIGSALVRTLKKRGYNNIVVRDRSELDLLREQQVYQFLEVEKPDCIILAAAMVGGIYANNTYRAEFIYNNLSIQNNVIWNAHVLDINKLVFLGSSCIYPREAPQPMPESALLTSPLEPTNRPYALAKIAGLELVSSLNRQYGREYFSVMPTNLYGPHDNFNLTQAHVLPALIRKFIEATDRSDKVVPIWGSGRPKREFLYVDDCADGILYLLENFTTKTMQDPAIASMGWNHINLGSGTEISIEELAYLTARLCGFKGELEFDKTKPDGSPRKLVDTSHLKRLGWQAKTSLEDGIAKTIDWYRSAGKSLRL